MATIGTGPLYDDDTEPNGKRETADHKDTKALQQRAFNIMLLLILLVLFMLGFNGIVSYEKDVARATFVIHGKTTLPVLQMHSIAHANPTMVAIVVHGYIGSKDTMTGFGVELANAGVTTYMFDLPAHSASSAPLTRADNTRASIQEDNANAVDDVVAYVRDRSKQSKPAQIVLIGDATGSVAVANYAINHGDDNAIISTILISPQGKGQPDATTPKNLLILVGQNDTPEAIANSKYLMRNACELTENQRIPENCGRTKETIERRMVILPDENGLTLLNSNNTFQEVLDWLHHVDPLVKTDNIHADARVFWFLLSVVSIILAMFPLCTLLVEIFTINLTPHSFSGLEILFFNGCLLVAIAVATAVQNIWRPFSSINILFTDYVSSYFFTIALIMGILILLVRRKLPLPPLSQSTKQITLGALLAVFLYMTLGQLLNLFWLRFTFTISHLTHFMLAFILLLPIFILDEGINRGYQEKGWLRGFLSGILFKCLLIGGLFVTLYTTPGLGFLNLVLPLLLLLFLVLMGFSAQLYSSGRAALTGAVLSALVVAWCLSTLFPVT